MSGYKIYYFEAFRGGGEPARMLLSILGVKHEQVNFKDGELKSRKSEFPTGQLPVLETEDGMINQSATIVRYLGKKHGFCGSGLWDEMTNDAMIENFRDVANDVMQQAYSRIWKGEELPKSDDPAYIKCREKLELMVGAAEKLSKKKGGKFINGDQIQICDVWLFCTLELISKLFPDSLEFCDWVKNWANNFRADERVKKYLDGRPGPETLKYGL